MSARFLDIEWDLSAKEQERVVPGKGWISRILGVGVVFVIFVAPVANVFVRGSMAVRRMDGMPQQIFDPWNFLASIGRCLRDYQLEFFWSMGIAAAGSLIVIVTASMLAFLANSHRVFRGIFLLLLVATLAIPGPLIGSTVFRLTMISNAPSWTAFFDRTIAAPTIASALLACC